MQAKHALDCATEPEEDAPGVTVRRLWGTPAGSPALALHLFEAEPGASGPNHRHAGECQVYVLTGKALLRGAGEAHSLLPGDTALLLRNEEHRLVNVGPEVLRYSCAVPIGRQGLDLTAQVAVYSLRQTSLSPAIDAALRVFREHGLKVRPGPMSSLVAGDSAAVFPALQRTFELAAGEGETVMVVTLSNACPVPGGPDKAVPYAAIGHVENEFDEPVSLDTLRAAVSRIVLDPAFAEGLTGLEPGTEVMVVCFFHRAEGYQLLQHPRGDKARPKRGVFALRSPNRPNPIGVTIAELLTVEVGGVLEVRGLDAINGTPVLDLKPA